LGGAVTAATYRGVGRGGDPRTAHRGGQCIRAGRPLPAVRQQVVRVFLPTGRPSSRPTRPTARPVHRHG